MDSASRCPGPTRRRSSARSNVGWHELISHRQEMLSSTSSNQSISLMLLCRWHAEFRDFVLSWLKLEVSPSKSLELVSVFMSTGLVRTTSQPRQIEILRYECDPIYSASGRYKLVLLQSRRASAGPPFRSIFFRNLTVLLILLYLRCEQLSASREY